MRLKIDRAFIDELLFLHSNIGSNSDTYRYEDLAAAIEKIEDPYTRGYLARFMDEMNDQGQYIDDILLDMNEFVRRVNSDS